MLQHSLRDTLVGHSCGTLSRDSCGTLLLDQLPEAASRITRPQLTEAASYYICTAQFPLLRPAHKSCLATALRSTAFVCATKWPVLRPQLTEAASVSKLICTIVASSEATPHRSRLPHYILITKWPVLSHSSQLGPQLPKATPPSGQFRGQI